MKFEARSGLLAFLLLGSAGVPLRAQDPDRTFINGVVVDAVTDEAVPNALVELSELRGSRDPRATLTDELGVFELSNIPPGAYVLSISQFGYETQVMDVELPLQANAFLQVALELKPYA